MYQHKDWQGSILDLPANKAICVGRNYLEHIKELNNELPKEPLLFLKPHTAFCDINHPIWIPKKFGAVDYETEIAILIGKQLSRAPIDIIKDGIAGIGIALDLTLREIQQECKEKGLPWEKAKAFDHSCPISSFLPIGHFANLDQIQFSLAINGEMRQQGDSSKMIVPILELISYASQFFTLQPGDVVLTGTPKGVGKLNIGDQLTIMLGEQIFNTVVI